MNNTGLINNELEMITDFKEYSKLLLFNDKDLSKSAKINFDIAQNNIEFNLPTNLEEIPLDNFINLRSQRNFEQCRKSYMNEIKKLIEAKEKYRPDYSLEDLLSYKKDFIKICQHSFNMVSALAMRNLRPLFKRRTARGINRGATPRVQRIRRATQHDSHRNIS